MHKKAGPLTEVKSDILKRTDEKYSVGEHKFLEFEPGEALSYRSRPGDVSKLFGTDTRHRVGSHESIRRRYEIFLDSFQFCRVDISEKLLMFRLLQTSFLR